jgi:lipopolysaccharide export system protein LptC
MSKSLRRRGMVLLQTLVISVILSMIAVMVLKWVLSRYMFAARNYRSTVSKVHSTGWAMQRFSTWNFNTSAVGSSGSTSIDTKTVTFTTSGSGATMRTFSFQSDQDQ